MKAKAYPLEAPFVILAKTAHWGILLMKLAFCFEQDTFLGGGLRQAVIPSKMGGGLRGG